LNADQQQTLNTTFITEHFTASNHITQRMKEYDQVEGFAEDKD